MNTIQANLLEIEAQSKRLKHNKKFFIIFLIILFTLILCSITFILTLLKHHFDSQFPSPNPVQAIQSVCRFTPYYSSCVSSISNLHNSQRNQSRTHDMNPISDIIRLSIQVPFEEVSTIRSLPQELSLKYDRAKIEQAFRNCLFTDSFAELNASMFKTMSSGYFRFPNINHKKILANEEGIIIIRSLKYCMIRAIDDTEMCLGGLEDWKIGTDLDFLKNNLNGRVYMAKVYMLNCLAILENLDSIREMFYPHVLSILGSFMLGRDYVLTIAMFCLQYMVLLLLFCSLLRVFVSRSRK